MSYSIPNLEESSRSFQSEAHAGPRTALQLDAMRDDRRQIRQHMFDKLRERGLDPQVEVFDLEIDSDNDEIAIMEDADQDAVVRGAHREGGLTDGRMEGFDSLERALHAHHNKMHYGRGSGFGWSQETNPKRNLISTRNKVLNMRNVTDWTDFNELSENSEKNRGEGAHDASDAGVTKDVVDPIDSALKKKGGWRSRFCLSLVLLVAIGTAGRVAWWQLGLR